MGSVSVASSQDRPGLLLWISLTMTCSEQIRLGPSEHCQIHEYLLTEHTGGHVLTRGRPDDGGQLRGTQRLGQDDLLIWRQTYRHLFLSDQEVRQTQGYVRDPLGQEPGCVTYYGPVL